MSNFILRLLNTLLGGSNFLLVEHLPVDKKEQALRLLKKRLANGEINETEYHHLKRKIENS